MLVKFFYDRRSIFDKFGVTDDAVFAIVAPSDIDPAIAQKLEEAFAIAAKSPEYLEMLDKINMIPVHYNSSQFSAFLKDHWKSINKHLKSTGVIKEAATKPE